MYGSWILSDAAVSCHPLVEVNADIRGLLGDTLVRLAYDNQTTASFVSPGVYDNSCPAVNNPTPAQGSF